MSEKQVSQPKVENQSDDEQILDDAETDIGVLRANYEISSYGADYPVDALIKRMDAKDILIPSFDPSMDDSGDVIAFQRKFVWARPQMDRFVESLLLGLPVPGIFLVLDNSRKLLVLDGQQRLRTLQYFYSGLYSGEVYRLEGIQEPFAKLSYNELEPEDRRRLDDSIIHATILKQEVLEGAKNSIYSIFERLNTGGSPLQPQEIRVALFPGPFLQGISRLNRTSAWRELYGPASPRLKDHELILRALAMHEKSGEYSRPLKGFLNDYLGANQERELNEHDGLGATFCNAMNLLLTYVGPNAFRPVRPVNAAVVDSVTAAVMNRIECGEIKIPKELQSAHKSLLGDSQYSIAVTSSTASEDAVEYRMRKANEAFSTVT